MVGIITISTFVSMVEFDKDLLIKPRFGGDIGCLFIALKFCKMFSSRKIEWSCFIEGKDGVENDLRVMFELCHIKGDFSTNLMF